MLEIAIPLYAHVLLLLGAFALLGWFEWRHERAESTLRRALATIRAKHAACEIQRDVYRRTMQTQSIELARYRGQIPPELRVTQVFIANDGTVGAEPGNDVAPAAAA